MTTKDELTVDWLSLIDSVVDSDADGIAQVVVDRVPSNVYYLVEGILWKSSGAPNPLAGATFELFAQDPPAGAGSPVPPASSLRSFTNGFTEAEADYATPRRFWPGESLVARWSGFAASFTAVIAIQVRVTQPIIVPGLALPEPELAKAESEAPVGETWN